MKPFQDSKRHLTEVEIQRDLQSCLSEESWQTKIASDEQRESAEVAKVTFPLWLGNAVCSVDRTCAHITIGVCIHGRPGIPDIFHS